MKLGKTSVSVCLFVTVPTLLLAMRPMVLIPGKLTQQAITLKCEYKAFFCTKIYRPHNLEDRRAIYKLC